MVPQNWGFLLSSSQTGCLFNVLFCWTRRPLEVWDDGAVWRSRHTEALTITHLFSFLTSPDLPDCLTPVTREKGRPSPAVYTSCFLFPTLFEKREVTDHMWGATQVPVSARLNVPFMLEHCSAKFLKKKRRGWGDWRRLMWSVGKQKHKRMGSVYAPAEERRLRPVFPARLSTRSAPPTQLQFYQLPL